MKRYIVSLGAVNYWFYVDADKIERVGRQLLFYVNDTMVCFLQVTFVYRLQVCVNDEFEDVDLLSIPIREREE